ITVSCSVWEPVTATAAFSSRLWRIRWCGSGAATTPIELAGKFQDQYVGVDYKANCGRPSRHQRRCKPFIKARSVLPSTEYPILIRASPGSAFLQAASGRAVDEFSLDSAGPRRTKAYPV